VGSVSFPEERVGWSRKGLEKGGLLAPFSPWARENMAACPWIVNEGQAFRAGHNFLTGERFRD
jgi:hypothetical protein